jgi:alpha-L-fucosidase 2
MLIQSHDGALHLLPALPSVWKDGRIKGLKARGNFDVEIIWQDGALSKATVLSNIGGPCLIRSAWPLEINVAEVMTSQDHTYFIYSFDTEAGQVIKARKAD